MDGRRLKVTAALWEELTRLGISAWQWGVLGVELGTYVKVWGEKDSEDLKWQAVFIAIPDTLAFT